MLNLLFAIYACTTLKSLFNRVFVVSLARFSVAICTRTQKVSVISSGFAGALVLAHNLQSSRSLDDVSIYVPKLRHLHWDGDIWPTFLSTPTTERTQLKQRDGIVWSDEIEILKDY